MPAVGPVTGPIKLSVAGDIYADAARILGVIWVASSTAGDTVYLSDPETGFVLWPGRTDVTNTYLGVTFGTHGLPAPNGFQLSQISSGDLYVYLRED